METHMENKKKIGIAALWLVTCIIGATLVSAARDSPNQPWNQILGMIITNTETDPVPVSIEGTVTLEGNGGDQSTPETKHVERIITEFPEEGITEVVNLEGYKDLQISWTFDIEYDDDGEYGGVLSLYWCSEEGYQVGDGEIWLTDDSYPDGHWGTKSTKIQSNYLKIQTRNDTVHEGDKIRLILYATK